MGGGYLANDAAAAWNAMGAKIKAATGTVIRVNGPDSDYREFARQVYWKNYWCSLGHCENAATPGYSNHGLGTAADVPDYVGSLMEQYGAEFGWRRSCSDAPWENWHWHWCGDWHGKDPGPDGHSTPKYPTLRKGDHGPAVRRAQTHLRRWNIGLTQPARDGDFGATTRRAVRQFQMARKLRPDGVIGKKTWACLRQKDHLHPDERGHLNRLRVMVYGGVTEAERPRVRFQREACGRRAHRLADQSAKHGWDKEHRRERYEVLKKAAGPKVYAQTGGN